MDSKNQHRIWDFSRTKSRNPSKKQATCIIIRVAFILWSRPGEPASRKCPVDIFSGRWLPEGICTKCCVINHPVDDFSERYFATRKANPVQKISHLHYHTSGYYFCGPGGIRTHNQQNRNLSFYPVELRNLFCKDTNQDGINSFCLTPAPNPESASADLLSRYKPESYSTAIANSN